VPSSIWIAAAIIVVIVVRRFSRLVGAAMGLVTSFVLAGWGYWVFKAGGGIALLGFELSQGLFYGFVALWTGMEIFELIRAINKRKRLKDKPAGDAANEESDAESEDEQ
jgi:hypothetical protein